MMLMHQLNTTLPNAFLGTVKNLPVIISYLLNAMQHEIRKVWDPGKQNSKKSQASDIKRALDGREPD
ncbi:hypothetical protein PIB30_085891, partial [Stylosanthes scabra]|nr:hypothetical protein [Stylosanthes scabra]